MEEMFAAARFVKDEIYGNRLVLFAPLYIGNECIEYSALTGTTFTASKRGKYSPFAAGGTVAELAAWQAQLFNNRVDAVVTAVFLGLVVIVVGACAREWVQLLSGRRAADLREEPFVPLVEPAPAK